MVTAPLSLSAEPQRGLRSPGVAGPIWPPRGLRYTQYLSEGDGALFRRLHPFWGPIVGELLWPTSGKADGSWVE